jgi:hypothetical protein
MACDNTIWQNRLDRLITKIALYEDAIEALVGANAVQSYTLDTGQTKQTVTKMDITKLQTTLDSFYSQYEVTCQRINGKGTVNIGAAW